MQGKRAADTSPTSPEFGNENRHLDVPLRIQAHYELEFENPSSVHARKLFADAERMGSLSRSRELGGAGNSNGSRHRSIPCSTSHHHAASTGSVPFPSSHAQPSTTTTASSSPSPPRSRTRGVYTNASLQTSPERERRKSREEVTLLRRVPEDGGAMEFHPSSISQAHSRQSEEQEDIEYDRLRRFTTAATELSPRYFDSPILATEDCDEEEEEQWILDEELARQGLYRGALCISISRASINNLSHRKIGTGSYRRLMGLYTLTPIFTLLVFLALAYLPTIAYPLPSNSTPPGSHPCIPYLPFPIPEILTTAAFWALSYLLNSSIFSFFSSILSRTPLFALSTSSLFQSTVGILLRLAAIPILHIARHAVFDHPTWRDIAFRRVWWMALGWAAAEAAVGIKQGYEGIGLYRDVLVSVRRVPSTPINHTLKRSSVQMSGYGSVSHESSRGRETPRRTLSDEGNTADVERQPLLERRHSTISSITTQSAKDALEEEVDRDVDELIALRGREELEDLYGMPFIVSPLFIPNCSNLYIHFYSIFLSSFPVCTDLIQLYLYWARPCSLPLRICAPISP